MRTDAVVQVPGAEGMIATYGGTVGGYGLYGARNRTQGVTILLTAGWSFKSFAKAPEAK